MNLPKLDEEPEKKATRIADIKKRMAFSNFAKMHFDAAMKVFAELDIDPRHVIGLFPDLLPPEIRSKYEYPIPFPVDDSGLKSALESLSTYLTQKRGDLQKQTEVIDDPATGILKERAKLSEIVDTALLKCYLQTNPALDNSFANRLRVPKQAEEYHVDLLIDAIPLYDSDSDADGNLPASPDDAGSAAGVVAAGNGGFHVLL